MIWDILWIDEVEHRAYRIALKRMTIADGIAAETLQDEIARREDLHGRLLLRLMDYALLRHATQRAEQADLPESEKISVEELEKFPLEWRELPFQREEEFLALPELLFWMWLAEFERKNPQYSRSYEVLKKSPSLNQPVSVQSSNPGSSENGGDGNSSENR